MELLYYSASYCRHSIPRFLRICQRESTLQNVDSLTCTPPRMLCLDVLPRSLFPSGTITTSRIIAVEFSLLVYFTMMSLQVWPTRKSTGAVGAWYWLCHWRGSIMHFYVMKWCLNIRVLGQLGVYIIIRFSRIGIRIKQGKRRRPTKS